MLHKITTEFRFERWIIRGRPWRISCKNKGQQLRGNKWCYVGPSGPKILCGLSALVPVDHLVHQHVNKGKVSEWDFSYWEQRDSLLSWRVKDYESTNTLYTTTETQKIMGGTKFVELESPFKICCVICVNYKVDAYSCIIHWNPPISFSTVRLLNHYPPFIVSFRWVSEITFS